MSETQEPLDRKYLDDMLKVIQVTRVTGGRRVLSAEDVAKLTAEQLVIECEIMVGIGEVRFRKSGEIYLFSVGGMHGGDPSFSHIGTGLAIQSSPRAYDLLAHLYSTLQGPP